MSMTENNTLQLVDEIKYTMIGGRVYVDEQANKSLDTDKLIV
jgi:hypothetical protein